MCKLKCMILVIVVILGLACSKREEKSGSSASNMKLSDIKINFKNKNNFIIGEKESSSTGRNLRSATNSNNLIVKDNESNLDYGLLSDYSIQVSDVIVSRSNEFAFVLLDYYKDWRNNQAPDSNVKKINCTILKIKLSTNEFDCLEDGLVIQSAENNRLQTYNYYTLPIFQEGKDNHFVFQTVGSDDFTPKEGLNCQTICIYTHNLNTGETKRFSPTHLDGEKFTALGDGNIVWTGKELNGSQGTGLLLTDTSGNTSIIDINSANSFNGDFASGEYKSAFYGSESSSNAFVVTRVIEGSIRKTYIPSEGVVIVIKGDDGNIYGQANAGLYSILPYKKNVLIPYDQSWLQKRNNELDLAECGTPCGTFFLESQGKIYYNAYVETAGKKSYELRVYSITDNQTVKVLKPNSDCTQDCYGIIDNVYRWFVSNKNIYITLKNLNTNKKELIKINDNINFSQEGGQFTTSTDLSEFNNNFSALSITGLKTEYSTDLNPIAVINNNSGDIYSVQIKFNKKMDYEDTESKIKIIDNSTNNTIGFMPLWNDTTLHLVIDTDNGTVLDEKANPLTSGRTYKVTLLGSAKDVDGNTLGSDVVKYITP